MVTFQFTGRWQTANNREEGADGRQQTAHSREEPA
jgi:hypothetical protein